MPLLIAILGALASAGYLGATYFGGKSEERRLGKTLKSQEKIAEEQRNAESRAMKEKSSMAERYDRQAMQLAEKNRQKDVEMALFQGQERSADRRTMALMSLLQGIQGREDTRTQSRLDSLSQLFE